MAHARIWCFMLASVTYMLIPNIAITRLDEAILLWSLYCGYLLAMVWIDETRKKWRKRHDTGRRA